MFTNIAKEFVYEAVSKRWDEIKEFTHAPIDQFISGLKIMLENCIIKIHGLADAVSILTEKL